MWLQLLIIKLKMLSKAHILRSSLMLTRASATIDGASHRTLQQAIFLVRPTAKPFSSSEGASEEENATAARSLKKSNKSDDEALPLEAASANKPEARHRRRSLQQEAQQEPPAPKTEDEFSDRDMAEFYALEKRRQKALRQRHDVRDPYSGVRVMTQEESIENDKKVSQLMESQPVVKQRFTIDEYNDWKKEVDAETVRTQKKIEHYKRSGELLKAIQDRISTANDKESQNELQSYLLAKLGYKQTSYSDFIGNQLVQKDEEAQKVAKRTSMLKADKETDDFINYNSSQVRDSANLQDEHAYNADAFVPSSLIDRTANQEERRLMTHQEFTEARARDAQHVMDKKLLWSGPGAQMNAEELEHAASMKELAETMGDDKSYKAIMEHLGLKPEETSEQTLQLRSFNFQKNEIAQGKAETEARLKELQDQQVKLEEQQIKNLTAIDNELSRQDAVNPDEIKTDDLSVPGTTDDEHRLAYRARKFEEVSQMSDWSDIEKELQKGPPIRDYWNKVTDKELEAVEQTLAKDPTQIVEIFQKVAEQDAISSELSERERNDLNKRKFRHGTDRDMSKADRQQEKELIFFEEGNHYVEFAKGFLAENGEGMSPEELSSLHEVQEIIRQKEQAEPEAELLDPLESTRKDFLIKDKHNFEQLKKDNDLLGAYASTQEEDAVSNVDFEAMTKEQLGTPTGERRFERVDRVSHDAPADKFDKLKLQLRQGRVYDQVAAINQAHNQAIMESAIDFTEHLRNAAQRLTNPRGEQTPTMPTGLTEAQQLEWKQQQSMNEQLALANGRVERQVYLEDWLNRDKSIQMASSNQIDTDEIMLQKTGMKTALTVQYGTALDLEKVILQNRQELAKKIKQQKERLSAVLDGHETLQKKLMRSQAANFESQVAPGSLNLLRTPRTQSANPLKTGKFSSNSKDVSHYERELRSISQLGLHKTVDQKDSLLRQFEFIFDAMSKNKVPITPRIRAHMFEYLTVRNDFALANTQLQRLTADMTESASPIDPHYLSYFLRNSLKHDNIDGIAYLSNYLARYKVDSSVLPIQHFHSMLDYYLNHNFNLSKVMVFCKFYRQFYTDTIARALPTVLMKDQKPGTLDEVQLRMLKDKVFAKHDSLIDMRALSKFLVRKTQNKQIIDPLTREDSLLGLIEMFTSSPDVYQASSLSKNNHIEPETIAEFFANRLSYPDAFQHVTRVALRLDGTKAGREFSTKMMEKVKAFQTTKNGALPASFSEQALRDLYIKIRSSSSLSAHTSEFLLYLLHQKGLHAEVVDLCTRMPGDIGKYYLTESLLSIPITKGSYEDAVKMAIGDEAEPSAMSLTQLVKAQMLDQGAQAAYTNFQAEFAKIEEKARQKKVFLVSLYDSLMPEGEVSFDVFRDRYLQSQKLASRFAKEGYVVNQMEHILQDKNYDQIENVFNLYAVLREERLLEQAEYFVDSQTHEVLKLKAASESEQLQAVRKRRAKLEQVVGTPDAKTLRAIQKVMQDESLTAFAAADADQIKKVASVFADVTAEEAATIESRNSDLTQPSKSAAKPVTKDSVIQELQDRGHSRKTVEGLYDLLDFDCGKAEVELMKISDAMVDQPQRVDKDLAKLLSDHQAAHYLALDDSEKATLTAIQKDYKQHIRGIVETRLSTEEALKIIKEIESDPANQQLLRDGVLSKDFDPSAPLQDQDEIDAEMAADAEAIKKHRRHRDQYIAKLQAQYPLLDLQAVFFDQPEVNPAKRSRDDSDSEPVDDQRLTKVLQAIGIVDKNGHVDPVLRAEAEQAVLDINYSEKFKRWLDGDDNVSFSEEMSEAGVNDLLKRRIELLEEHENLKALAEDHVMTHELSDLSEVEEATDAQKVMKNFWQTIEVVTDVQLKKNLQEMVTPRIEEDYLQKNIFGGMRRLQQYQNPERNPNLHLKPRRHTERIQNEEKMEKYRDSLLTDHIPGWEQNRDPQVLAENAHNQTAFSMKEQLLFAMNKRKHEALPIMIKMFNQIQSKRIGDSFRLDDFESKNQSDYTMLDVAPKPVDSAQVSEITKTLQKLDILLNDSRSPLISALAETQKYNSNKLPEFPEQYYKDYESWISQPLDVDMYKRDSDKLAILKRELDRIEKTVDAVDTRVKACIENVNGELNHKLMQQRKKDQQEAREKNMSRLRLLHNEFNTNRRPGADEAHKVRVMRDVLALELGQSFAVNTESGKTAAQFPVFYALDLINFGIKRNQPAAIRLGEKLLTDSVAPEQAKLPQELAMSMKNYMLDYRNNMGYRDAMKISGPLNSSSLFHMQNQQSQQQGISYCLDDPYWQEFVTKNRRREDQWRNPTVYAHQYKQYGILGEILDMDAVQKKYDRAVNRPL